MIYQFLEYSHLLKIYVNYPKKVSNSLILNRLVLVRSSFLIEDSVSAFIAFYWIIDSKTGLLSAF